jgi:hypothetical protein
VEVVECDVHWFIAEFAFVVVSLIDRKPQLVGHLELASTVITSLP